MRAVKLIILSLAAATVLLAVTVFPQRLCFDGGKSYTFYCGTSSKDCKIVTVSKGAFAEKLCLKDVCGESCDYDNFELEPFLEAFGAKVVFKEELSGSVNYYCTANLPYSVNLYGKEINLHVSVHGDGARVASPIIFGGY